MCHRILAIVALLITAISLQAQKLQVVDVDGHPIAYVCITTDQGILIGSTDDEGWIDDIKGNSVLCLSHIAFQDTTIMMNGVADNRIVMNEVEFNLPDVEVTPKELAYVQTYYRLIYFSDEGPIYFRGGLIDNTYEFATQKSKAKTRNLSKGMNGMLRFLISTLVGRYIDQLGQVTDRSTYKTILKGQKKGYLSLTGDSLSRQIVSDSISTLGYVDTDLKAGLRTTSFDYDKYQQHLEDRLNATEGKKSKKKERKYSTEESYYEVYRIDDEGRSRIEDFVMRQIQIDASGERNFFILLQAYTTKCDYIDKKEFKQTRKDNEVDMNILELKQFEKANNIPPLAPNIQELIDKLFEKELNKK